MDQEKPQLHNLVDFRFVFEKVIESGLDFVLVAGHASNYWGERYAEVSGDLEELRPLQSKDVDLLLPAGSDVSALRGMFPKFEAYQWTRGESLFGVAFDEENRRIDLLRDLHGVLAKKVGGFKREVQRSGSE